MMVWQDSVGNICGRYEGQQEGAPAVLLGSHLDTVRNAGRYDGMLGVLAAIEVVQRLHQQGRRLAKAIEIVALAMKRAPALASPCSAAAASPAPGLKAGCHSAIPTA
ncbi:N-carbamoyl-L-amino acid hydrolase [Klebsiella variicola]|nr:N-carbamoyl-L-amino acid hydrolase [Klebsiella variicola]